MQQRTEWLLFAGELPSRGTRRRRPEPIWGCRSTREQLASELEDIASKGGKLYFFLERAPEEPFNRFGARACARLVVQHRSGLVREIKKAFRL